MSKNDMKSKKVLVGVKGFQDFLGVSAPTIYNLFKHGMPVNLIEGRIYGHTENVEEYFKAVTRCVLKDKPKEPENVIPFKAAI